MNGDLSVSFKYAMSVMDQAPEVEAKDANGVRSLRFRAAHVSYEEVSNSLVSSDSDSEVDNLPLLKRQRIMGLVRSTSNGTDWLLKLFSLCGCPGQ